MTITRTRRYRVYHTINGSTDGVTPGPAVTSATTFNFSDWRSDGSPNRNWRGLIRDGKNATTSLQGERIWVYEQRCNAKAVRRFTHGSVQNPYYVVYPSSYVGTPGGARLTGIPVSPSMSVTAADALASKKFYKKVKEVQTSFEGGIWLGELKETIRMLRNPAQSLFKSAQKDYLDALKRRKARGQNWSKGLSGFYLEWFYGVRPLVSDIEDALSTVDLLSQEKVRRATIRASGKTEESPTVTYDGADSDLTYGFAFNVRKLKQQLVTVRYIGLWMQEIEKHGKHWTIGDKARQLGLTLDNFLPTVWNLLPWSFLVDYFTTIGDVIETTFTNVSDVRWINKTVRLTSQESSKATLNLARMRQLSPSSPLLMSVDIDRPSEMMVKRIQFTRSTESPKPVKLAFELPGSPLKWLAMGSLLAQANGIHPQRYKQR